MTALPILVEGVQYNTDEGRSMVDALLAHGADPNAIAGDGTKILDCDRECRVESVY